MWLLYYVKTNRRYFVIEHRCVNFIYQMSKYYGKQKHNLHFNQAELVFFLGLWGVYCQRARLGV